MSGGSPDRFAEGPDGGQDTAARRRELAAALRAVNERIESAAHAAGRDPGELRLIVVTKFFPASDLALLASLGVTDIGESRDQEAGEKLARLEQEVTGSHSRLGGIEHVHFIGQLQTNKATHVARYADVIHSVDRGRLVTALQKGAAAAGRQVQVLLQVSLDGDTSRGGALPSDLAALASSVQDSPDLRLRGLMAVAPRGADPDAAFGELHEHSARLRGEHPDATWVSAGMSADLESAVRHGATHLRVGTAILGSRQSHQ